MTRDATLIITEKPAAAAKIAAALSGATDEKITNKDKVSYYEFYKGSRRYIVGCAVGHLFGVQQIAARGPFPNFEIEWQPAGNKKGGDFTRKYLSALKKLSKEANEFIVATDFDVEGEVIGWNVVRFVCGQKDAKRMKFSLLTKDALEKSFENLLPTLNWGAAISGETRHYLDWFYGINLSRGLMKALSSTGTFRILSIGRVQGPALKIVVDREREIEAFIPEAFWNVFLQVKDIKGQKLEVKFPSDIFKESELLKFKHLQGKKGEAVTTISEQEVAAPIPFDLTTLQTEAYKYCGTTPTQTLKSAQSLYLSGAISYPRTSSQKYDESIGYADILKKLKKHTSKVDCAVNTKPTEGTKVDPAHPAIYPTGEKVKIAEGDKKIYDLIVKRFISCFCETAILDRKKVAVKVGGLGFSANGTHIKKKGWMDVYPHGVKEVKVPTIDGAVDILEIRTEEKETKPPRRYSAASLVKELEKRNLGTKATRANIIETLYSRGYVREKSIEVTELGMRMCDTLEKYAPVILDEKMTADMTVELDKIEEAKGGFVEMEKKVLEESKKVVLGIAKDMTKNMEAMGKCLSDANAVVWEQEKEANTMDKCRVCGKGNLRIMYGKKFGRYFVSCDAYPTCKTIYGLPPKGQMKPARVSKKDAEELSVAEGSLDFCKDCGFPLVVSFQKGKAPWKFCFNMECASNEEAKRKKEEFKAKMREAEATQGDGRQRTENEKTGSDKGKIVGKKKIVKRKVKSRV